jgi:hypothetical protein
MAALAAIRIKDQAGAIRILDSCCKPDHPVLYSYVIDAYMRHGYYTDQWSEFGRLFCRTWGTGAMSELGKCLERVGHAVFAFDAEYNYSIGKELGLIV